MNPKKAQWIVAPAPSSRIAGRSAARSSRASASGMAAARNTAAANMLSMYPSGCMSLITTGERLTANAATASCHGGRRSSPATNAAAASPIAAAMTEGRTTATRNGLVPLSDDSVAPMTGYAGRPDFALRADPGA